MVDRVITEEAKRKRRDLSLMWIDYKNAYDSVPHLWIQELMIIYKVNTHIVKFITRSMKF